MPFGELKLGFLSADEGAAVPPPTDVAWAGVHSVDEDAALGTVVGGALSATDPGGLEVTFSLADDDGGNYGIGSDGTSVVVTGVPDFEVDASPSITIRATNSGGSSYDEAFEITVNDVAETPPEDPLPEGEAEDDGTFSVPVVAVTVDGAVKLKGKKNAGSLGKFLYDLGAPAASTRYTMEYDPDFTLLSNTGKDSMVGFVAKAGNDFFIIGPKGDGAAGLDMFVISGDGLWTSGVGLTETDEGAPTHGTQAGPNWLQVEFTDTTVTARTSADGETWVDEIVDYDMSPFANLAAINQFGPGALFPPTDTGSFTIAISAWIEEAITFGAWSSTFKHADVTLSNSDRTGSTSGAVNRGVLGNCPITRKSYWEVDIATHSGGNIILGIGVQGHKTNVVTTASQMGLQYNSNGLGASPLNVSYTTGDRIGFAYDPATGGLWVRKNGSWLGNDPSGAAALSITNVSRVFVPMCITGATVVQTIFTDPVLFGAAAPAGFLPLEAGGFPGYRWSTTDKGANLALSENDTKVTKASTGHNNVRMGTEPCKGKQVFAIELTADGAGTTAKAVGLMDLDDALSTLIGGNGFSIGYRSGGTVVRGAATLQTYTAWGTVGDIIMVATNADTNELWFGLNGTWNGDPAAGTGEVGQWVADGAQNYGLIACGMTDAGDAFKLIDWPYAVPAGFDAPPAA